MKFKRKFFCVFMAAVMLAMFIMPSFAEESAGTDELVEKQVTLSETTIEEDFENLKNVGGHSFDIKDYPAIEGADPQLLTIVEDCKLPDSYELYIYIYNPGQLVLGSGSGKIQLSFDNENFYKFICSTIDVSDDKLFHKLKATIKDTYWSYLDLEHRTLNFSGFEFGVFSENGWSTVEYATGTFLGTGIGDVRKTVEFTFEGNNPSKMTKAVGADALHLNVDLTYYRTTSSKDDNALNQLVTACFLIPNAYFDNARHITSVHYQYEKYSEIPIAVSTFDVSRHGLPIGFLSSRLSPLSFQERISEAVVIFDNDTTVNRMESLSSIANLDRLKFPAGFKPANVYGENDVGANAKFFYFQNGSLDLSSAFLSDFFLKQSLPDSLKTPIEKNIDVTEDKLVSDSYVSKNNFLERWLDFGLGSLFSNIPDDSYTVDAVALFDDQDLKLSDSAFSEKYKVAMADVATVKQKASNALKSDSQLVFLRIDVAPVYVYEMDYYIQLKDNGKWTYHSLDNFSEADNQFAFSLNNVYKNFDVLDIGFQKGEEKYIIPVVSNPVTYVPKNPTPSERDEIYDLPKISGDDVWALIGLVLGVLLVIYFAKPVSEFAGNVLGGGFEKRQKKIKKRKRGKK